MRTHITRLMALLLAAVLMSTAAAAQTSVSTVEGTVTDEQGAVLPGVTATLTGPRGDQTVQTDERGMYRFIGVQPGTYILKIELGTTFAAQTREVSVGLGKTAVVDFTMKMAALAETVNVVGGSPVVDVKSAATDTSVSQNMLQMTPLYSSTATGLLNAAPGVNSSSAYGGQGSYGNALLLDGVDTRDPEGGSAWTFFNQNLIEEIQIGGLGAPAEYGGFTGAIINTVTKSGGNMFSGLFSMRYTDKDLASKNISAKQLEQNANLGNAAVLKKLKDYTVQMGGPIARNKAFFFASVQRYSALSDPVGPVANSQDISPRINLKFTLQPTSRDTLIFGTQYDQYNLTGRVGYWPSSQATDRQTVEEDAPEWVWNAQWRRSFGTSALFEAKFTGYSGYYYLDPVDPSPFTYDGGTNTYSGGGGGQYYADRDRNQLQASLTKYAQKFGSHSFKFGAEIERSGVRSRYQPYGPAGFYNYAYYGVPYYRVSYGYDVQGDNRRTSAYVQDQWSAGRATLNLGLRMDHIRGFSPVLDRTVYTPKTAWGPRVGAAVNLTESSTSVLKAFWGRYYEGAASAFYTAATPGIQDYTHTPVDDNFNPIGPPEVIIPAQVYGISDDIKHPRTDEFNVSFEQQLMRGMRFTATGIWRWGGNFINNVIAGARWSPRTLNNSLTNQPFTAYAWTNQSASNSTFRVQNTEGFQYLGADGSVVATADPQRKYRGLMLVLSNSLRGRVGYQFSYVLSKAEGNVDNSGFGAYLGGSPWTSPNNLINAYGELTNSRRHEIKAYFTYNVPKVDIMVGGNYTGLSGRPYTASFVYTNSQLPTGGSARRTIFLQPRGSSGRNDFVHQVDLRTEKVFNLQGHRFGVYADMVNLFNDNAVTVRQATYPTSGGIAYQSPTGIQGARQITFGGRWSF
ncbi:MAG TPA: TonB-dependent receptor [Vicinamibacterales bacterium]|nr:TonB-dependent receptor [Vicinamibacterales bacterium]